MSRHKREWDREGLWGRQHHTLRPTGSEPSDGQGVCCCISPGGVCRAGGRGMGRSFGTVYSVGGAILLAGDGLPGGRIRWWGVYDGLPFWTEKIVCRGGWTPLPPYRGIPVFAPMGVGDRPRLMAYVRMAV